MEILIEFLEEFDLHQIIVLLVFGFYFLNCVGKRFNKLETKCEKEFDNIKSELKSINQNIFHLDQRTTRIEGRFEERGYWESRSYHIARLKEEKNVDNPS